MGQIQNAINNLAMTAAGGAVAKEVKTQGETMKEQLAVSQEQLKATKKKLDFAVQYADNLGEHMGNPNFADELLNAGLNRDPKKGTSAVKLSNQQAKSKSQQNKNKRQRFEIKKGKLRRL